MELHHILNAAASCATVIALGYTAAQFHAPVKAAPGVVVQDTNGQTIVAGENASVHVETHGVSQEDYIAVLEETIALLKALLAEKAGEAADLSRQIETLESRLEDPDAAFQAHIARMKRIEEILDDLDAQGVTTRPIRSALGKGELGAAADQLAWLGTRPQLFEHARIARTLIAEDLGLTLWSLDERLETGRALGAEERYDASRE